MIKHINCKHGLDKNQELEARRIRTKLEARDNETLKVYNKLYMEHKEVGKGSFEEFLKEKDIVLYSAYERAAPSRLIKTILDIDIRNG